MVAGGRLAPDQGGPIKGPARPTPCDAPPADRRFPGRTQGRVAFSARSWYIGPAAETRGSGASGVLSAPAGADSMVTADALSAGKAGKIPAKPLVRGIAVAYLIGHSRAPAVSGRKGEGKGAR